MVYSSYSGLVYKGSLISVVRESKYIWLQGRKVDSSSLTEVFVFSYTEGRTFILVLEARQTNTLNLFIHYWHASLKVYRVQ